MPTYVALLRGVSPENAPTPALKRCFEDAGFRNVKTVLASGNVIFDASATSPGALESKIEKALEKHLRRPFPTVVRKLDDLKKLIVSDPFKDHKINPEAKKVVTFLKHPPAAKIKLPFAADGVRILKLISREAFTVYIPHPKGPLFMRYLEKTFGKNITTRTWETVKKIAR